MAQNITNLVEDLYIQIEKTWNRINQKKSIPTYHNKFENWKQENLESNHRKMTYYL